MSLWKEKSQQTQNIPLSNWFLFGYFREPNNNILGKIFLGFIFSNHKIMFPEHFREDIFK